MTGDPYRDPHFRQVMETVEAVKPLLAGKDARVQGGALADLVAMWLAGHNCPGDPQETRAMRARIFEAWGRAVQRLVPLNADEIGTEV